MGHSQAEKLSSHERILDAAADRFRARGFDGVSIADLMAEIGLTHGGFYKHFPSRDQLVAEAMERAFRKSGERSAQRPQDQRADLDAFLDAYLSTDHLEDTTGGCPVAALAADAARTAAARPVFARHFQSYARWIGEKLEGPPRERLARGKAIACAVAGAVAVARTAGSKAEARAILQAVRQMIVASAPAAKKGARASRGP